MQGDVHLPASLFRVFILNIGGSLTINETGTCSLVKMEVPKRGAFNHCPHLDREGGKLKSGPLLPMDSARNLTNNSHGYYPAWRKNYRLLYSSHHYMSLSEYRILKFRNYSRRVESSSGILRIFTLSPRCLSQHDPSNDFHSLNSGGSSMCRAVDLMR